MLGISKRRCLPNEGLARTRPFYPTLVLVETMSAIIEMHDGAVESTETAPKNPLTDLVAGYPKLAGHMEIEPEAAIFRRFGALNARNLLYMQSELCSLEKKLIEREKQDNRVPGYKSKFALDWYWLSKSEHLEDTEQLDLILKIRKRLKAFSEYECG